MSITSVITFLSLNRLWMEKLPFYCNYKLGVWRLIFTLAPAGCLFISREYWFLFDRISCKCLNSRFIKCIVKSSDLKPAASASVRLIVLVSDIFLWITHLFWTSGFFLVSANSAWLSRPTLNVSTCFQLTCRFHPGVPCSMSQRISCFLFDLSCLVWSSLD